MRKGAWSSTISTFTVISPISGYRCPRKGRYGGSTTPCGDASGDLSPYPLTRADPGGHCGGQLPGTGGSSPAYRISARPGAGWRLRGHGWAAGEGRGDLTGCLHDGYPDAPDRYRRGAAGGG